MSEHIKTGEEIYKEILEYSDIVEICNLSSEQWVSLSWLQEQIEGEIKTNYSDESNASKQAKWVLKDILKLLEEK